METYNIPFDKLRHTGPLKILNNMFSHYIRKRNVERSISRSIIQLKSIKDYNTVMPEDAPVFVYWDKGQDNMPLIIKVCIENNKKYLGKHPLIILNSGNILERLPEIRDRIEIYLDWLKNGKIFIQYFSDLLRTDLLYYYGGIWIDATLFLTQTIDSIIGKENFYTGRRKTLSLLFNPPIYGKWTSYFIAVAKGNEFIKFLNSGLKECVEKSNDKVSYFTLDYLFLIAYEKSIYVKKLIKNIKPYKVTFRNFDFNQPFNDKCFSNKMKESPLYKCDRRKNYIVKTKDEKLTMLGKIVEDLKL